MKMPTASALCACGSMPSGSMPEGDGARGDRRSSRNDATIRRRGGRRPRIRARPRRSRDGSNHQGGRCHKAHANRIRY